MLRKIAKKAFKFGLVFPGFFVLAFVGAITFGILKAKKQVSTLLTKRPKDARINP